MKEESHYQKTLRDVHRIALENGRNPEDIAVIAVTKGYSHRAVLSAYSEGCRDFGESRMQEVLEKKVLTPKDIQWHLIGTLQSNKAKKAIGQFVLIHSVDNPKLAQKLSQCSQEAGVTTRILLQVNTSGEISKHGLNINQWRECFSEVVQFPFLKIEGLMTMAPLTDDLEQVRGCFAKLRHFRDELRAKMGLALPHLSMGMSHDYPIAIAEGATLLRIGTAMFE
jgi:pyridoxal phosphate enzyme (YggS family)